MAHTVDVISRRDAQVTWWPGLDGDTGRCSMAEAAAIAFAPGVWRVPTQKFDLINSYVFRDGDGQVTLVDTGLKWAPKRILSALKGIGSGPSDVTRIVLTHCHSDHVGGAAELV